DCGHCSEQGFHSIQQVSHGFTKKLFGWSLFNLNLSTHLLDLCLRGFGECRCGDVYLPGDLAASEDLVDPHVSDIDHDHVAFLLGNALGKERGYDLVQRTDIDCCHVSAGLVAEPVLSEYRAAHLLVPLDKVVGIDAGTSTAAAVSCTATVLVSAATACPRAAEL